MFIKRHARTLAATVALTVAMSMGAAAKDIAAGALTISDPWARATPAGAAVGAGYMTIVNSGKEADRLVGGSFAGATSMQIHEMSMDGGIMRMRELAKGLEIKPGASVQLKPGGYHVMFMGLKQQIKEGAPIEGTLVFERAGKVSVQYTVKAVGAGHGGH